MLQNRRFDQAMIAFLDCLRQMMDFVKTKDKNLKFPHASVASYFSLSRVSCLFTPVFLTLVQGRQRQNWRRFDQISVHRV